MGIAVRAIVDRCAVVVQVGARWSAVTVHGDEKPSRKNLPKAYE
jgi:hypothetical protein